jgi:hypothetical protein
MTSKHLPPVRAANQICGGSFDNELSFVDKLFANVA